VVIKTRIVQLKRTGADAVSAHLRYIARDRIARDSQSSQLPYDATKDGVDLEQFQARGANNRHQFRFIIAPEDAAELGDLRGFIRDLMERVSGDLGTPLDWVAVDHWDTENPHTHLVLHGRDGSGKDLVIAGEYIAKGMRTRASELATSWLGPRTDAELHATLEREVQDERWTSLDRQLKARIRDGRIEIDAGAGQPTALPLRTRLIGRLRYLQKLGLAQLDTDGSWRLREDAEEVLRRLGERGDIIRTIQRSFGKAQRELTIFDPASTTNPVVGRIADKGLVDELGDRSFVVVDGVDGRAHYVPLPSTRPLADLPVGGIVEVWPATERRVDRNIAGASLNGMYVPRDHMTALRAAAVDRGLAADMVASHVRRLEALRRARIVERVSEGLWRIPPDLVARGLDYDRRRHGGISLRLCCRLAIERQVRAIGATWLDQQLVEGKRPSAAVGFAASVESALKNREDFLVEKGFAQRQGLQSLVAPDMLAKLRELELSVVAKTLSAEVGLPHRPVSDGARASGTYRRSVDLVSGRFALLDDGLGFSLVPWKPVIEKQLGRSISAVIRGDHVAWHLGRSRTPSIT
jgi:type IV secretory pathway VirD2 relaxase